MYKIKDKKSLLRLLKQHDLKGYGGIYLEDIQESLPHCEKHLKVFILFYNVFYYYFSLSSPPKVKKFVLIPMFILSFMQIYSEQFTL